MKKKLIGVLAIIACLACVTAGCNLTPPPANSDSASASDIETSGLEAAADYLQSMYREDNKETRADYTVIKEVAYLDVTYPITWTVNVTEGVKVEVGENDVTINVDEGAATDIAYELTATLTDAEGNTVTVSFSRTVLQAPTMVPVQITEAPVAGTAYKYYVYQGGLQQDMYFAGTIANKYYFGTTDSFEKGVDIYVEYVTGSTELFNLYFTDSNGVKQYIGVKQSGTHLNPVFETEVVSSFKYSTDLNSIITTVEDGTECYLGSYESHDTISASKISYATSETSYVGHLVGLVDRSTVTDDLKVEAEKNVLSVAAGYVGEASVELATQGVTYPDVTITWALEGEGATLNGNVLTIAAPEATTSVTLKATIASGNVSVEKSFTVALVKNETTAILAAAKDLASGAKFGNEATLKGVIKSVDKAYDADYGNVTVTMTVNDTEVECYRLEGKGADVIAAGYTITVTGILENYQGSVQFGKACKLDSYVAGEAPDTPDVPTTPTTPAEIVDAAYALASGASMEGTYTLTGVITKLGTWNSSYSDINVTFVVEGKEDKPMYCYGLKGASEGLLAIGDTITVTGTIKNYNGTVEFDKPNLDKHTPAEGGDDSSSGNEGEGETEEYATLPVIGTAYVIKSVNSNGDLYFSGSLSSGRINGTNDIDSSVSIYFEATATDAQYYIYFMNGETKTYIVGSGTSSSGFTFVTTTPDDVWVVDTAKMTIASQETGRVISTQAGSTYTTFSTYAASNMGQNSNYGVYTPAWFEVASGSGDDATKPDDGETEDPVSELPADGSTLTIKEVLALNDLVTADTTQKYYTTGVINNVYNTTYGNMYIKDAEGNEICVYGTYSADGSTKYDAMTTKPVAGDTIKIYGILSTHNGKIQFKDAWIVEHTPAAGGETEDPITELPIEGKAYKLSALNTTNYADSYITGESSNGAYLTVGSSTSAITVTFEKVEGIENGYYIKLSTGNYVNAASSGNKLSFSTKASTVWVIDTENKTIAQHDTVGTADIYYLQYNANKDQERISRYKGTQQAVWFEEA